MLGTAWAAQTAQAQPPDDNLNPADVTNVHQIRLLAAQIPKSNYNIRLEGDVWWASPAHGRLVLKDDSGAEELEMDLHGQSVEPGQRVRLNGNGTITPTGAGFRIGVIGPVVDNDGIHGMVEKSGAVFLKAGRSPIRVEWFNGVENMGSRWSTRDRVCLVKKIPGSALFRVQLDKAGGPSNWVNGLDFSCSEATNETLPEFNPSTALKTGTVDNFDLSVMARPEHVGLSFAASWMFPVTACTLFTRPRTMAAGCSSASPRCN